MGASATQPPPAPPPPTPQQLHSPPHDPGTQAHRQGHCRARRGGPRSEEHTSELQSRENLVCRHLLEKKKSNRVNAESRWINVDGSRKGIHVRRAAWMVRQ